MSKFILLFLFCAVISAKEDYKRYDNFKVLKVLPTNEIQLKALQLLQRDHKNAGLSDLVDFWLEPSAVNSYVDLMINPIDLPKINRFLTQYGLNSQIVVDNVQKLIDDDKAHLDKAAQNPFKAGDNPNLFDLEQYHSFQEINDWIDSLVAAYPDRISTVSLGPSFEKRDLKLVKIGKKGNNKPGYFIDAGIHAREWIAVSTAVYVINELVTKSDTNPVYKEYLDKIDFYILPSINPDGYEFSRNKDRMWRKTRSGPSSKNCYGADANRNFDYHWGEKSTSSNPCDYQLYRGDKPFSEIETLSTANFLSAHNDTLKVYISLHSYSQLFMYPYGYKRKTYPEDLQELKSLATEGAAAITAVNNTKYQVGSPPDLLYECSGISVDWAKAVPTIKWVYTLELRPSQDPKDPASKYGFVLPPEYISPVGEETWAGLQVVAKKIIN